ncbi:MAG TPA: KpsF/GutQ family sugar-phosphate isomerase [Caldithrix abyssi]|uniref:KpsF/GutQ family sugar-phosphate isomerase n=1 Tax=Caldithrix abyssi TaxID=187145 RepID=A0A7V5PQU1_CALAY|nr:KpsF/GutQ family sugar-phosphate isomerase [Caldithrix abyssi]
MNDQQIIEAGRRVIRIEKEAIAAVEERIGENFSKAVKIILNSSGRVIVTGMGKSGAIGRKIASTLSSTGTTAGFLHPAEGSHGDLGMVLKGDVILAISKSGETSELIKLLPSLRRLDVPIIAFTGKKNSTLARYATVVLDISVKEEACPNDLAPTASTTVTLALGDALAVALLESRGFTAEDFALLHPGGSLGKKLLMRVEDIMENGERLPYCRAEDPMRVAILEMAHKRGICPVVDDGMQLIGVVTTGDLNRLIEKTDQFSNIPVGQVMNPQPKFIHSDDLATIAYRMMEKHRIIAMPVLDRNEKLVGVVHLHDLMQEGISG